MTDEVHEPRWPVVVALLACGGCYLGLHPKLTIGPSWMPLAFMGVLLVPIVIGLAMGRRRETHILGHVASALLTAYLITSVVLLVLVLPTHQVPPGGLLRSAVALWVTNILLFASWYWRLDAGGPLERAKTPGHESGSFYFPQMTMSAEVKEAAGQAGWSPGFVDYLFLAFNTSTALSPADTPALSRWAKALMMTQSSISLTVIALLAARAVNIL